MPNTVRATLGWLFAGILAPLALATAGLLFQQVRAQEAETRERLGAIATTLVGAIDAELERGQALLEVLAVSPQFKTGDFRALYDYAKLVAASESDRAIVLVAADGQPLFSTAVEWGRPLPNLFAMAKENRQFAWNGHQLPLSSGDLTARTVRSNKVAFSNLYYAANVKRPALALAVPASRPRGARYALLLSLSPSLLQEMVRRSVTAHRLRVVVADRNGVVVASNAASTAEIGQRVPLTAAMLQQKSGPYSVTAREGAVLNGVFAVSDKNGFVVRVAQPAGALLSDASSLAWIGLYLVIFCTGIALVQFHSRRLTTPIKKLADAVSGGHPPPLEKPGQLEEIKLLSHAVRLAAEATKLQRNSDERQIRELRDRALFSEQMVGIVSHDLRNPLLAAQFAVQEMRAQDHRHGESIRHIQEALDRAQVMIRDLLDFTRARIGSGIPVDLRPLDLNELIRNHLTSLRRSYSRRQLVHRAIGEGPCEADPDRLMQLIDNLVSNAVAYGAPHAPVTITSIVAEGYFRIEVHNEGDPIPADVLPRVFDPMWRASTSQVSRLGGVGLGLYIVRKIAEAHAGEVKASSSADAGTTFTATFPR